MISISITLWLIIYQATEWLPCSYTVTHKNIDVVWEYRSVNIIVYMLGVFLNLDNCPPMFPKKASWVHLNIQNHMMYRMQSTKEALLVLP